MFIAFDGLDGCGKSSLILSLKATLKEKEKEVKIEHQPSDSFIGTQLRYLLHNPQAFSDKKRFDMCLSYLACANRLELLDKVQSDLDTYHLVSRYVLSTLAYGCNNFSSYEGTYLKNLCIYFPPPDYYFYIDTDPYLALQRINMRESITDSSESQMDCYENLNKLVLTHKNYDQAIKYLNSHLNWNIYTLDGTDSIANLNSQVLNILGENYDY